MKFSMECSLCERQLRFPVTTTTCRHNFCSQCVFVYLKTVKDEELKCPRCNRQLKKEDFREDKSLNEVFRNLEKTREAQSTELSNEKMHVFLEYYQLDKQVSQKIGAPCSEVFDFFLPRSSKIAALKEELKKKLQFKKRKNEPFNVQIMNCKQNKEYSPQITLGTVAFEYGKFDNLRIFFTVNFKIPNKGQQKLAQAQAKMPCATSFSKPVPPPKIIKDLQSANKKDMTAPLAEKPTTPVIRIPEPNDSPCTLSAPAQRSEHGPPVIKPQRPPAPPRIISPRTSTAEQTQPKVDEKKNTAPSTPLSETSAVENIPQQIAPGQPQRPPSPNKIFDTASIDVNSCRFITHVHFDGKKVCFEPSLKLAMMKMPPLEIDGKICVFYMTPYGLMLMKKPMDIQAFRYTENLMNPKQYTLEERPPRSAGPSGSRFVEIERTEWTKDPRWMRIFSFDLAFVTGNPEFANRPLSYANKDGTDQKLNPYKVTIINPYEWPNKMQTFHPMSLKGPSAKTTDNENTANSANGSAIGNSSNSSKTSRKGPPLKAMITVEPIKEVSPAATPKPQTPTTSFGSFGVPFAQVQKCKSLTPPPTTSSNSSGLNSQPPILIMAPPTTLGNSANGSDTSTSLRNEWQNEAKPPALKSMVAEEPEKPASVGGITFKKLIEQRKQAMGQDPSTDKSKTDSESEDRKRRMSLPPDNNKMGPTEKKPKTISEDSGPPTLQPVVPPRLVPTTVPPGSTVHFVRQPAPPTTSASPIFMMPHPGYPSSSSAPDATSVAMIQSLGAQFKQNPNMPPVTFFPQNGMIATSCGYINTSSGPASAIINGKPMYFLPNGMQVVTGEMTPIMINASELKRIDPPPGYMMPGRSGQPGMIPMQSQFIRPMMMNGVGPHMKMTGPSSMPRMKSPPAITAPPQQYSNGKHSGQVKLPASTAHLAGNLFKNQATTSLGSGYQTNMQTTAVKKPVNQRHSLSAGAPLGPTGPTHSSTVTRLFQTLRKRVEDRERWIDTGLQWWIERQKQLQRRAFNKTNAFVENRRREKYGRMLKALIKHGEHVQMERLKKLEENRRASKKQEIKVLEEREAAMRAIALLKAESPLAHKLRQQRMAAAAAALAPAPALAVETRTTHEAVLNSKPSPSLAAMPVLSSMSPSSPRGSEPSEVSNTVQMPKLRAELESDDGPPRLEAMDSEPPIKKMKPEPSEEIQETKCSTIEASKQSSVLLEALKANLNKPPRLIMQGNGIFSQNKGNSIIAPEPKKIMSPAPQSDAPRPPVTKSSSEFTFNKMHLDLIKQANRNKLATASSQVPSDPKASNRDHEVRPPSAKSSPHSHAMPSLISLRPPINSISPQPVEQQTLNFSVPFMEQRSCLPVPRAATTVSPASVSSALNSPSNLSNKPNEFKFPKESGSPSPAAKIDTVHPTPPPSNSGSIDFNALAKMKGQSLGKTLKDSLFGKRKSSDGPRASVSPAKQTEPSQSPSLPIKPSLAASQ